MIFFFFFGNCLDLSAFGKQNNKGRVVLVENRGGVGGWWGRGTRRARSSVTLWTPWSNSATSRYDSLAGRWKLKGKKETYKWKSFIAFTLILISESSCQIQRFSQRQRVVGVVSGSEPAAGRPSGGQTGRSRSGRRRGRGWKGSGPQQKESRHREGSALP